MEFHVWIEDDIVELVDDDDIPSSGGGYVNRPHFNIIAKDLGITTLYVSSLFEPVPMCILSICLLLSHFYLAILDYANLCLILRSGQCQTTFWK